MLLCKIISYFFSSYKKSYNIQQKIVSAYGQATLTQVLGKLTTVPELVNEQSKQFQVVLYSI